MSQVVYLVDDLLFTSKIRETAKQLGLSAERVRDPDAVLALAASAQVVVLDLRLPQAMRALDLLAADPSARNIPTVGFIDHERLDDMETARQKGCTKVLAKGKFSSDLPSLLAMRP